MTKLVEIFLIVYLSMMSDGVNGTELEDAEKANKKATDETEKSEASIKAQFQAKCVAPQPFPPLPAPTTGTILCPTAEAAFTKAVTSGTLAGSTGVAGSLLGGSGASSKACATIKCDANPETKMKFLTDCATGCNIFCGPRVECMSVQCCSCPPTIPGPPPALVIPNPAYGEAMAACAVCEAECPALCEESYAEDLVKGYNSAIPVVDTSLSNTPYSDINAVQTQAQLIEKNCIQLCISAGTQAASRATLVTTIGKGLVAGLLIATQGGSSKGTTPRGSTETYTPPNTTPYTPYTGSQTTTSTTSSSPSGGDSCAGITDAAELKKCKACQDVPGGVYSGGTCTDSTAPEIKGYQEGSEGFGSKSSSTPDKEKLSDKSSNISGSGIGGVSAGPAGSGKNTKAAGSGADDSSSDGGTSPASGSGSGSDASSEDSASAGDAAHGETTTGIEDIYDAKKNIWDGIHETLYEDHYLKTKELVVEDEKAKKTTKPKGKKILKRKASKATKAAKE